MNIPQFLRTIVLAGVALYLMRQVRKPSRWLGRPFAWLMNSSHSALTDWGLEHATIKPDFAILDVGCGGGRTIQKLADMAPNGHVSGIDYAAGSVAASRSKNAELIRAGRVDVQHASVSKLPFPEDQFDLVTAVETQYYWPDLANDMREILRVLKPGGTLLVILESYAKGRFGTVQGSVLRLLGGKNLSVEQERELFASAGYTGVDVFEEKSRGWLCVTGKKPLR
ncbi:MAG TPA: class I SAM-dependent methyltransferase [Candidatus Acidoferrales bacterium]|nr:class I SAM-dependent methyltransferase [Candidatus Acidoferrales bacterium]